MTPAFRSGKVWSKFGNSPDQCKLLAKLGQPWVWLLTLMSGIPFSLLQKAQGLTAALSREVTNSCHRLIFFSYSNIIVLKEQLTPRPRVSQYPGKGVISYWLFPPRGCFGEWGLQRYPISLLTRRVRIFISLALLLEKPFSRKTWTALDDQSLIKGTQLKTLGPGIGRLAWTCGVVWLPSDHTTFPPLPPRH